MPSAIVMPKVNIDGMLEKIIANFNLERPQASRQLRAWKVKKYDNAQVKIVIDPEDIELSIMEGISMKLDDYRLEVMKVAGILFILGAGAARPSATSLFRCCVQ